MSQAINVGDLVRFANERDGGPVHRVVSKDRDGMVDLHDMGGYFAPHLFVVAEDVGGIPPRQMTTGDVILIRSLTFLRESSDGPLPISATWRRNGVAEWGEIPSGTQTIPDDVRVAIALMIAPGLVEAKRSWLPIETAPKDGTVIILGATEQRFRGEPTPRRSTYGFWWSPSSEDEDGEQPGWTSEDGGFTDENPPTHWQPTPEPPL